MKTTIEHIRQEFKKEGYDLLSTTYEGCMSKLDFVCPNGHIHSLSWNHWQRGVRCSKCRGYNKITPDIIKSFVNEGYTLLSDEFTNKLNPLRYICPKGHNNTITLYHWNKGIRCGDCCTNNKKNNYDDIKKYFLDEGYTLLSETYNKIHDKLDFICPNGHRHSISWNLFKRGSRCGRCFGNIEVVYQQVEKSFVDEGYQLLSTEYKKSNIKLDYICPKGHRGSISWNNWQRGKRCGKCRTSKPEIQLLNYIKFTYPHLNIIHQDRTIIFNPSTGKGLEFDIWIPELNKAIEMDGIVVHSLYNWSKNDELKNQLCEEKGIPLLRVTDEEWYTSDKVRSKIHRFINQ